MDKEVSFKFSNKIENLNELEKYSKLLSQIQSISKGIDKGTIKEISEGAKNVSNLNQEASKTDSILSKAFSLGKITAFVSGLKSAVKTIGSLTSKSSEYTENLNLYAVAFDGATESADKFVNKLTEMYGLDESWLVRTTGIFKQLSNAMALSTEQGTKLATLMTQMSVDISSLYNIDIERASSVLQSSLAGQTKPIRGATGADITQATLQTTLDSLGIDRYIGDLSYAEKRLVIIISLTQQLKQATNDFGKTIESPANQTRILDEQWQRLSRSVGNLFLPILSKVLPYLNATLMVLTEIINVVAGLLGFDLGEYDYGVSGVADSVLDLEDSLNGATSSASKLKKEMSGLRSFDKLNVIKTPTSTKGSSGTGGAGGISPDLMKAFNSAFDEYNEKLKNVNMRANKIRDSIMEWLGFTKKINSETGDISWEFEKITSGTILGSLAVGGIIYKGINGIITALAKIGLIKKGTTLSSLLKGIATKTKNIITALKNGTLISSIGTKFSALLSKVKAFLPVIGKVATVVGSIVGIVFGTKGLYEATKKMTIEQKKSSEEMKKFATNATLAIGGATALGAVIGGPLGAAIGAGIGLLVEAVAGVKAYKDGLVELAESQIFGNLSISTEEWTNIISKSTTEITNWSAKKDALVESLNTIYNSFQTSSDALDLYGLKFGTLGQKITDEDAPKIINAINQMTNDSTKIIDESTTYNLELWSTAFSTMSTLTEEEEKNILNSMYNYGEQQKKEISDAQDNITKTYNNAIKARGYLTDEEYKYIETQLAKIRQLTQTEMTKNQANIEYYKTVFADKNVKLDEQSYADFNEALKGYQKEQNKIIEENYRLQYENLVKNKDAMLAESNNKEETWNKLLEGIANERVKQQKNLEKEIDGIQKNIYESLANKYAEIENLTGGTYKEQRKIIEDIFKDIDVDDKEIVEKFASIGKKAGETCAKNIATGINKAGVKVTPPSQKDIMENGPNAYFKATTNFKGYATGGLPPVGQLFVANERGPELVGHIGGQSFVANQNQMMDLLDKKIGNSGSGVKNATFVINVGSKKIAEQVLTDLEDMAKSNGKPITING